MIRRGIHRAESDEEKLAVYRFRYDVYVEEMGRYGDAADHERRVLTEPEDETAHIFYAAPEGNVVATARMSWGGDGPFSARQIESYQLQPFLAEVALEAIAVGERGMVAPELRGSDTFRQLNRETRRFLGEKRVQLGFGACEPHLLSLYLGQGFRTYAEKNINSADSGYLVPLVMVAEDVEYLRRIGSPIAEETVDHGDGARIPASVERLINPGGTVTSQRLSSGAGYWGEVHRALGDLDGDAFSALSDFSEDEAARCLGQSNIIECSAGDRVLKKGGVGRNMFVVLDGTLEVRDGDALLRVLTPGDVLGEIAFLLGVPRSADVYAATDGVRILSLSEGTIRKMIENDPNVAARLLLNISKILCLRVLKRT
jgi:predicted GNAT family N-acyltransferase